MVIHVIENKIEQRLQIERQQLNYRRYNTYKKNCAWSPHQLCKKRVIIVFNMHVVIIVQKRYDSFEKSSIFACNYLKSFDAKYGISKIIELNFSEPLRLSPIIPISLIIL